jgi:hypothetical protein
MSKLARLLKGSVIMSGFALAVAALFLMRESGAAFAQENARLRFLFEQLAAELEENPGARTVVIQFATPIYEGAAALPIGVNTDGVPRRISEVGDDYFCLTEGAGESDVIRCVPYHNVAAVSWVVPDM